jgi:RimJ/RimL family protein N-acetyltransferase
MKIRKTIPADLDGIMVIYDYARLFMKSTGNGNQWVNGYPSWELIMDDISQGNSYVITDDTGETVGTFYFRTGEDPTYVRIYNGQWLSDTPYGVVHRLAGNGKVKGLAAVCLQWCFDQCKNIRVDTHHNNKVMQHILQKMGYAECGIIYIANGTARIAFQKQEL